MANYFTHLAFDIPASAEDAERFVQFLEAATAIENDQQPFLGPEIEALFRSSDQNAEQACIDIVGDLSFGLACRFDMESETIAIFDTDGAPNLWALAKTLQRLFPEKLPLGFAYSCSCDKPRSDGFGGGLFAVGSDTIVQRDLGELLAKKIADLSETADAS